MSTEQDGRRGQRKYYGFSHWVHGVALVVAHLVTTSAAPNEEPPSPAAIGNAADGQNWAGGPIQDLYGDDLPPGAVLRLGTMRLSNRWSTYCVAFSPDGRSVAAGGRAVRIFDVETGRLLNEIAVQEVVDSTWALTFSPDGRHVATGDRKGNVRIYSILDGKQVLEMWHGGQGLAKVGFFPDGRTMVTFGGNGDVRLWDVETGKQMQVFQHGFARRSHEIQLAVSPDAGLVAASADSGIRIWNVATGAPQAYIAKAHDARVTSLAFTPDGETLVSCGVRAVVIGADNPETRHTIFLSQIRTWDVETGKMQRELLTDEPGRLSGIAVPANDDALVAGTGQAVFFLDPVSGEQLRSLELPRLAGSGLGNELAVSPDGRALAIATSESAFHIVDLETGQLCVPLFESHTDLVRAVDWSADGEYIVTGSSDGTVRIWNAETSQLLRGLDFCEQCMNLFAVSISPDGELVAAAGDFNISGVPGQVGLGRLWNAHTGRQLHEFQDERGAYFNLAFSSDGKLLAAAPFAELFGLERGLPNRRGAINIFRTDTGHKVLSLAGHDRTSTALRFAPGDERLISVSLDRSIHIWELPGGESLAAINVQTGQTAAISLDGDSLVTGSGFPDKSLAIRELPTGEVAHTLRGNSGFGAHALDISADGKLLVSGCQSDSITIWEMQTGEKLLEIPSPQADVFALAFDPSGRFVVTGMDDGTAVVWDVSKAREIAAAEE